MPPKPNAKWGTDSVFAEAVRRSDCAAAVLRCLGLKTSGGNYETLRKRLRRQRADTSHWTSEPPCRNGRPLDAILTPASGYTNRYRLKRRLLKDGRLRNQCYVCGLGPAWNGVPLVFVLDHVNGIPSDWRPENLRLLCPNCNSQQPTFAGRNRKRRRAGRPVTGAD